MFLITFSDQRQTFAWRSIVVALCVISDDPRADLGAELTAQRVRGLLAQARTLGFGGALMVFCLIPLHVASRYFADPVVANLGLVALCVVLGQLIGDLQMLRSLPQRTHLRRPTVRLQGRKPRLNVYGVFMAVCAALIFGGMLDMADGDMPGQFLWLGGFLFLGLEAGTRAVMAFYYAR